MQRRRPGSPCARPRCDFRSCASSSTNASRASAWSPASRSTRPSRPAARAFSSVPISCSRPAMSSEISYKETAKAWTPMRTRCSPSSIISKASRSPIRATTGSRRVGCRLPTTGCCTRRTKCRPMARSKCPMPHRWRSSKPAWTSRWSGSPSRSGFTPAPRVAARDANGYRFPPTGLPRNFRKDDRIIIPQHPHGHTLQIDFGRLKETDQSTTRIRYTTESDKGTSGAPCFNHHFNAGAQQFKLVGLHNADYRPDGVADSQPGDPLRSHLEPNPCVPRRPNRQASTP